MPHILKKRGRSASVFGKRCNHKGCNKLPNCGKDGRKAAIFCTLHDAEEGMVHVGSKE